MTKKVPKIPPSPPKTKILDEKCVYYFTQKDLPASQKTEIVLEKMTKNWQKSSQKEHQTPQKVKFCMKKMVFFYSKIPPSPAKNWNFAWKNDKKLTKKIKNHLNPKFCMKNWKPSYLWGFWKKKSRPPTSPNF